MQVMCYCRSFRLQIHVSFTCSRVLETRLQVCLTYSFQVTLKVKSGLVLTTASSNIKTYLQSGLGDPTTSKAHCFIPHAYLQSGPQDPTTSTKVGFYPLASQIHTTRSHFPPFQDAFHKVISHIIHLNRVSSFQLHVCTIIRLITSLSHL